MKNTERFLTQNEARASVEQRNTTAGSAETVEQHQDSLRRYLGAEYYVARRAAKARHQGGPS